MPWACGMKRRELRILIETGVIAVAFMGIGTAAVLLLDQGVRALAWFAMGCC